MASNRPSKSERQRRNRARREARQARSAKAGEATELYESIADQTGAERGPDDDAGSSDDEETAPASTGRTRGQQSTAAGSKATARRSRYQYPGQRAVVLALLFTVASVGLLLFTPVRVEREVPADEVPAEFEDDAELSDDEETATYLDDVMLLDEEPVGIALVIMGVPVAITGAAVYFKDHQKRSTIWTFAMLGMAGYVFFLGGAYAIYTLPALIALGVGGFQARRDENKERVAELRAEREARRAAKAGRKGGDGEVIDVEPVEEDAVDDAVDDTPDGAEDTAEDRSGEDEDREP